LAPVGLAIFLERRRSAGVRNLLCFRWTIRACEALIGGSAWRRWPRHWALLPVLLSHQFSQRTCARCWLCAGVMLATSSFSLIIPALASAFRRQLWR
jgi:hypothetical protein